MDGRAVGSRQRRHSRGGGPRPGCGEVPALGRTAAAGHGLRAAGDRHSQLRPPCPALRIEDRTTIQLACLQVRVQLRGAQMQDPELTSALALFRRAANILARLEDGVVLDGLLSPRTRPSARPPRWRCSAASGGDAPTRLANHQRSAERRPLPSRGAGGPYVGFNLPRRRAPGRNVWSPECLDQSSTSRTRGYFGPYALVLGQRPVLNCRDARPKLARAASRPNHSVPGRRIAASIFCAISDQGVVVALGGSAIELVVATDLSLQFLQVTVEPVFIFRVFEKIVLRIKDPGAITALRP